ncbi:phage antirepressor [Corynebacterium auriscanis]|uniref:phage antirepressor n=1 Tax=Corynebacterium auriscanis TaxID=99807 RepID=UPI003CE7534B
MSVLDKQITLFNFCGEDVRVIDRDGEPWFVLSEVCKTIGVKGPVTDVRKRLDLQDVDTIYLLDRRGHDRKNYVINEPGIYNVIFMSRKPEAQRFKRWVMSEVLPSIRKHGAYMTPQKIADVLTDPDTIIQLAQNLKAEQEARIIAEAEKAAAQALTAELQPKANAYDRWMDSDGTADYNTVARILGIGRNTMLKRLREAEVLMSQGESRNVPHQRYAHHFKVVHYEHTTAYGAVKDCYIVRVLPTGVELIAKKLGVG